MTALLIKNARVFAPQDLGKNDVLMVNDRIAAVGQNLAPQLPDLEILDAGGKILTPGFFDQHIHVTGGGGEGGPSTRTPELVLSELIRCGHNVRRGRFGYGLYDALHSESSGEGSGAADRRRIGLDVYLQLQVSGNDAHGLYCQ